MKPVNYLKNVMKSVVYSASDVTGEYLSTVKEFKETNKEFTTATYAALKNPKALVRKQVEAIQESKVFKALDYGVKNTFEDLRTGNFYNKERKERDELRLSGLDTDFDDLSDFGIDDDWDKSSSSDDTEITAGDKKIVESIEGSNAALASATVNAVISGSESNIKANRANTAMLYTQNAELFGGIHKDITILGNTMSEMHKIQSASLQNIDKNLSDYFTTESKLSAERNAMLKEILEIQRNLSKPANEKTKDSMTQKKKRISWSDISSNGVINIPEYFKVVKKNVKDQFSSIAGMPSLGEDSNMLAEFMISPIEYVLEYVIKGVIPATAKVAAKELNNSMKGIFGTLIARMSNAKKDDEGGILSFLGKLLGIRTSVDKTIDTSKYEKGAVPFDGITRKAIIDVIPTHLRRIEAALTGSQEQIYDYNTGKWTTMAEVKKKHEDAEKNNIKQATSNVNEAMKPGTSRIRAGLSEADQKDFDLAMEEFNRYMYERNGDFNPNLSIEKNKVGYNYTHFRKYYKQICTVLKNLGMVQRDMGGGKTKKVYTQNSVLLNVANDILEAKERHQSYYDNINTDPSNIVAALFETNQNFDKHGKFNKDKNKFKAYNTLDSYKDVYGNTVFNYLQNINKELSYMRLNGTYLGGTVALGTAGSTGPNPSGEKVSFDSINLKNPSFNDSTRINRTIDAKKMSEKIKKGEAIDARDFETDEVAALATLANYMSKDAAEQLAAAIIRENGNSLSQRMNKTIYKPNVQTKDEKNKNEENEEENVKEETTTADEANDNIKDKKEKSFLKKVISKISKGETLLGGVMGASAEAFQNVLYTADRAIYEMMFKYDLENDDSEDASNKKKYKGFMDMLSHKVQDGFTSLKNKILEDVIDPFKKRLGLGDDAKERFKAGAKNVAGRLWSAFKDANAKVYGPLFHDAKIAAGIEEGETRAKRQRKENRQKIHKEITYIESLPSASSSLFLPVFDTIMRNYGLKPTDYETFEEARSAILSLMHKEMYNNSKNLTEVADNEILLNEALKHVTDNKSASKVGKAFGFIPEGENAEELQNNMRNIIRDSKDKSQAARIRRETALNRRSKDQAANIEAELDKYGFRGSLEDRKTLLRQKASFYGKNLTNEYLDKLTTVEAVNKAALRLINNNNAKGTTGEPFSGMTTLTKGEGLINGGGFGVVPKTGVYNVTTPTHIINTEDMHSITGGPRVSVQQALGKEKLAAKAAGYTIDHNDKGTLQISGDNKLDAKSVFEEAKKYIPEAAGGGLVGGILSLVLGLAGGPIIGAALGAGGSIIAKSNMLKDALFGKADENDNRKGGIIPKAVTDTVKKYAPDMTKYGMAGIIPGLVTPLGPIGGLLVGSAVGFLKNNERFTNKYFGEGGKLSIKSADKELIQKLLPNAAKGAAAGALSTLFLPTPFGFMGNAVLGAGIGILSTTDHFKDFILGTEINGKRMGGLVGALKEGISPFTNALKDAGERLVNAFDKHLIEPIAKFITPAIHFIPNLISSPFRKLNKFIAGRLNNSKIKKTLESRLSNSLIGRAAGGIVKGAGKAVSGALALPGNIITGMGERMSVYNITHGDTMGMNQAEAVELLRRRGKGDKVSAALELSSRIGAEENMSMTKDQAKDLASHLMNLNDNKRDAQNNFRSQNRKFNSYLGSIKVEGKKLTKHQQNKIRSMVDKGITDTGEFKKSMAKVLTSGKNAFSESEIEQLLNGDEDKGGLLQQILDVSSAQNRLKTNNAYTSKESMEAINAILPANMKNKIDLNNRAEVAEFIKLLKGQTDYLDVHEDEDHSNDALLKKEKEKQEKKKEEQEEREEQNNDNIATIKDLLEALVTGNEYLHKNNQDETAENAAYNSSVENALNNEADKIAEIHEKNKQKAIDIADKNEDGSTKLSDAALDAASIGRSKKAIKNLGTDAFNAIADAKGNSKKALIVPNKIKKFIDNDAMVLLSTLKDFKLKGVIKVINNSNFEKYLENSGANITKEDIEEFSKFTDIEFRDFIDCCKAINKSYKYEDIFSKYGSVKSVREMTRADIKTLEDKHDFVIKDSGADSFAWQAGRKLKNGTKNLVRNMRINHKRKKAAKFLAGSEAMAEEYKNNNTESENSTEGEPEVAANGLGTFLLGTVIKGAGKLASGAIGLGKKVVGGAVRLAKNGVSKIKGLFSKKNNGEVDQSQVLPTQTDYAQQAIADVQANGNNSGTGEVDKQGDGKSVLSMGGADYGVYKRDSSGNVEPDTTDSHTKAVLNKLSLKEKITSKLQAAQMKACETIKNTFDTSDESESKGGKIGWFKLLLTGAFLTKTGILKKLFDGVIKPVWSEHLWPFLRDKAIPGAWNLVKSVGSNIWGFITDNWETITGKIKQLWTEHICPAIKTIWTETIQPALHAVVKELPSIIWEGIKFGGKTIGKEAVEATKNTLKNKDGEYTPLSVAKGAFVNIASGGMNIPVSYFREKALGKKTVDTTTIEGDPNDDSLTDMTDENGNQLTSAQIANGEFKKIFNKDGVEGTVNEDGSVSFTGATGEDTTTNLYGKAMVRSFAKGMAKGRTSTGVKAARGVANFLTSKKGIAKTTGKFINSVSDSASKAEAFGKKAGRGIIDRTVDNTVENMVAKAAKKGLGGEELKAFRTRLTTTGDGSKFSKFVNKVTEFGKKRAEKKGLKQAAKDATKKASKSGGILKKITSKLTEWIEGLFSDSRVLKKLEKLASSFGEKNSGKWIIKFKDKLQDIFTKGLEKNISKVGAETTKQILHNSLSAIFIVTGFIKGCDQAEAILGVTETSIAEEIVAGIINALIDNTFLGLILDSSTVARSIFKLFNIDLSERQAEAKKEYEEYINKTGSTISEEEYLKRKYSKTGKIGGFIDDTAKKAKNAVKKGWKAAKSKLKKTFTNEDGEYTFGSVVKGAAKTAFNLSPAGVVYNGAKAVGKRAKKLWNKAKGLFGHAEGTVSLDGIESSDGSGFVTSLSSTLLSPLSMLKDSMDSITSMMDDSTTDLTDSTETDKVIGKAKDGKLSVFSKEYWKEKHISGNKTSLAGSLKNAFSRITKFMNAPMLMIKDGLDSISDDISTVDGSTGTKLSSSTKKGKSGWLSGISNKINSMVSKFGTGASYSKQIDPFVANVRYNSSNDSDYQTIGNSGCGPAAAVNVLESMYGRGNAVTGAANFALKHGYKETNGGTKPGFFSDYFSRNGLGSQTTSNRNALTRNIKNGMPTVLMGKDAKGTSSSTPFGKNPHYVTVTGMDGRGNAIVQDPESKYDNQLYPLNNLISKTSLGVSAYGRGGEETDSTDENGEDSVATVTGKVWWYLKNFAHLTDAGAAGLIGNLIGESGLKTNNLEDTYNNSLGMSDEEYTAKVDSGDNADIKNFFTQAQGYGLAQWTSSGRKEKLYDLAKSKKVSISDLGVQLQHLNNELNSDYGSVLKTLQSTKDVVNATDTVLNDFERPAETYRVKSRPIRQNYAKTTFNQFKNQDGIAMGDVTTTNGSNSSDSSSNNVSSFISILTDIISNSTMGKMLSALLGGGDSSSSSSSSSTGSSSGSNSPFVGGADANSMVQIAKNEVGNKEEPAGSNKTKYNNNDGNPWCASFVSWTADQAGVDSSIIPRSASSTAIYNGVLANNGVKVNTSDAQPGDLVLFTDNGNINGIYHIGIVESNTGKGFTTIEGNHSDQVAEGGLYEYSNEKFLVVRPKYATATSTTDANTTSTTTDDSSSDTSTEEYADLSKEDALGSNGCKPLSRYGQFKESIYGGGANYTALRRKDKNGNYAKYEYFDLDKSLNSAVRNADRKFVYSKPKLGMGAEDNVNYSGLINAIIKVLMTIADNTDKLNTIVSILNSKLGTNITAQDVSNHNGNTESLKSSLANILTQTSKLNNYADQASDGSMNAIITAMNAIAAE